MLLNDEAKIFLCKIDKYIYTYVKENYHVRNKFKTLGLGYFNIKMFSLLSDTYFAISC